MKKVSRMDVIVVFNTFGTDDRMANPQKSEKSLFLSKKRDEHVVKIGTRDGQKYNWKDSLKKCVSSRVYVFSYRKFRTNRENLFCDLYGEGIVCNFDPLN